MRDRAPHDTRQLSTTEQVRLLRNHVEFLAEEIAEKERRLGLLEEDIVEIRFLAEVNERVRGDPVMELCRANELRIEALRREIDVARTDLSTYRRVLTERYGVRPP